jgi:hypothetical protein
MNARYAIKILKIPNNLHTYVQKLPVRNVLRWIFRKWGDGLDQAGSRHGQVAALVNAVMSLQVPHKMRGFS